MVGSVTFRVAAVTRDVYWVFAAGMRQSRRWVTFNIADACHFSIFRSDLLRQDE